MFSKDPFAVLVLSVGVSLTGAFALILHTGMSDRKSYELKTGFGYRGQAATISPATLVKDFQRGLRGVQQRSAQIFAEMSGMPVARTSAGGYARNTEEDYGDDDFGVAEDHSDRGWAGDEEDYGGSAGGYSGAATFASGGSTNTGALRPGAGEAASADAGAAGLSGGSNTGNSFGHNSGVISGRAGANEAGRSAASGNYSAGGGAAALGNAATGAGRSSAGGYTPGGFKGSGAPGGQVGWNSRKVDLKEDALDSERGKSASSYADAISASAKSIAAGGKAEAPSASKAEEVEDLSKGGSEGGGGSSASGGDSGGADSAGDSESSSEPKEPGSGFASNIASWFSPSEDIVPQDKLLASVAKEKRSGGDKKFLKQLENDESRPEEKTGRKSGQAAKPDPEDLFALSAKRNKELKLAIHSQLKLTEDGCGRMTDTFSTSCKDASDTCSEHGITGEFLTMKTPGCSPLVIALKYSNSRWAPYTLQQAQP